MTAAAAPEKPYGGCVHVGGGTLGPLDWRYHLKRSCECCGRGALSRHPTKRRQTLCEDCGGIMRPKRVPRDKERWVIGINLEVPVDAAHEADAAHRADELAEHLAADPRFKDWVGSVDVRPWTEFDELV